MEGEVESNDFGYFVDLDGIVRFGSFGLVMGKGESFLLLLFFLLYNYPALVGSLILLASYIPPSLYLLTLSSVNELDNLAVFDQSMACMPYPRIHSPSCAEPILPSVYPCRRSSRELEGSMPGYRSSAIEVHVLSGNPERQRHDNWMIFSIHLALFVRTRRRVLLGLSQLAASVDYAHPISTRNNTT